MNRRKFLSYVGCSCCGFFLNSCTTAPITERKQLKIIPESKLNAQAAQVFEQIKKKEKMSEDIETLNQIKSCLLYTSPSPRDATLSRMPSSA